MKKAIVWFRDNLRVHDNHILWQAVHENDAILPIYIKDENLWLKSTWENVRTGNIRSRFLEESLYSLQETLKSLGGNLLVLAGNPVTEIQKLAHTHGIDQVYTSRPFSTDERNQEKQLSEYVNVNSFWESSLLNPEDLPFAVSNLPNVFSHFRKKVEREWKVAPVLPELKQVNVIDAEYTDLVLKKKQSSSTKGVLIFTGGEDEALARLQHYFWETKLLATYKETRNGLLGADYSSKFSPWLANGCLSPRFVYWQIKQFEQEVVENDNTYWLIFELLWRDYFKFVSLQHGPKLFLKTGIKGLAKSGVVNKTQFEKWRTGKTGEPFVDANMRELLETGFMSNRGRQNVASYLIHDMGLDWRMGADWFESQLIDYDPCSNYGNWQYIAGVGNDPRPVRKFNVKRQAEIYDEKGEYQRLWLNQV